MFRCTPFFWRDIDSLTMGDFGGIRISCALPGAVVVDFSTTEGRRTRINGPRCGSPDSMSPAEGENGENWFR